MVAPLLIPVILSGVSTGVTAGFHIIELYHKNRRNRENERYWNDYLENTGLSPSDIRYPYRAGYMDSYLGDISTAYQGYQYVSGNLGKLYR